ncbi:vitamin K epoxide reductase family protein [Candidatus Woesearchaeota archaeon]|nr:vitamin K epoxide reductase family protein [Candidatus Woesearchaeota archaeon]
MNPIYLIILSLVGFAVSFYIFYTKKYGRQLHCVIGQDCDAVVKSKYGKTFGIENTIPGMLYYALVFAYGISVFSNRNLFKGNIIYYFVVIASIASVLFAVYLTSVQAFVLKKWCEYCIVSSIASLLILLVLIL